MTRVAGPRRSDRPARRVLSVIALDRLEARSMMSLLGAVDASGGASVSAFSSYLPSPGAPGTPAFTTYYDLAHLPADISDPAHPAYPWLSSFDQTTQTLWLDLRGPEGPPDKFGGGDSVIQLDPATGMARTFDLRRFEPDPTKTNGEPHGIAFDFESHLTPRIWFTQRQAGLLNFIDPSDPANNTLSTYNFGAVLKAAGFPDVNAHAVSVAPDGTVWLGDPSSKDLYEFDFRHLPDGQATGSLSSLVGTMTVHPEPLSIQSQGGVSSEFVGPHGIQIITDQQTGQDYVYFTNFGNGRISVLLPGAGAGGQDVWVSYDVSHALGYKPNAALPLFPSVDTNETPGDPLDDTVFFADAGGEGAQANNVIRQLIPGPISSTGVAGPAILKTFQIPSADPATTPIAGPLQVFVDREGRVHEVDRRTGFGRLDPTVFGAGEAGVPGSTITVIPDVIDQPQGASFLIQPSRVYDFGALPEVQLTTTTVANQNVSQSAGLDQYLLRDIKAPGSPVVGPLRASITTNNVVFSSLTEADDLVAGSIFAETDQRPMTVTVGPGDARQAFQVLRDGHLIVTYRGAGELLNQQLDLTAAASGPAIVGDVSAVMDSSGLVHIFGQSGSGLAEYVFNPATSQVIAEGHPMTLSGVGLLDATPTAIEYGPFHQIAALITTSSGHLLLDSSGTGQFIDLTAQAGNSPFGLVYSSVGEAEVAGIVYVYGTDQQGDLIEYQFPVDGGAVSDRKVNLSGGRDTMVFQDVEAIAIDGVRNIFATDGAGRLVHVSISPAGDFAENVSNLVQSTAQGYSPYQQLYAGRINPDVSPVIDPTTGTLYVYGVNGRDLVEFARPADGSVWKATDLTNALPANRVFGGPAAYITAGGDRHILQINQDGEVVEYAKLLGLAFSTENITLSLGNTASPPVFPTSPAIAVSASSVPAPAPATVAIRSVTPTEQRVVIHPKMAIHKQPVSPGRAARTAVKKLSPPRSHPSKRA